MIKKFVDFEIKDVNEEERTFWAVASTGIKDRDGDIIEPAGWKLKNFKKNPVILWAHEYRSLPIANAVEIKIENDRLMFKPKFIAGEIYPFAETLWQMYKNRHLRTFSVGFMPLKFEDLENDGGDKGEKGMIVGVRYTSQELLEISGCPVPSNVDAMAQRAFGHVIAKSFGLIEPDQDPGPYKGAIPFKTAGKDPDDAVWDAGKEVKEAEVADLKIMCTWVNSEEPDLKTSYKLPHQRAKGHNVVWRAVAAAMAALLGARGGVRIPAEDRQGVYNHLAKHYKQFDKEPPEFKEYDEPELREIFEDVWFEELGDIVTMEMELGEIEEKSGRVLSEKNRSLVKKCVEMLTKLLEASEPAEEGDKELTEEEKKAISGIGNELAKITESIKGGKDND